MKRNIVGLLSLVTMFFTSKAQVDQQICIDTDQGILTLSKTADGKDMIIFSITCWDRMVAGTKYNSRQLSGLCGSRFYLQISDKKRGHCDRGIGFGCSIFDGPSVPGPLTNCVNNENRICAVTAMKLKAAVKIIFDDHVNWKSLQFGNE